MTMRTAKVRKRSGKWVVTRSGWNLPRCFTAHTDAIAYASAWTHCKEHRQLDYTLAR